MRIRTQLALGFLLLAILPLTGIVLFSYLSSLGAVRRAMQAEAASLTRTMDERLDFVQRDLEVRLGRIGAGGAGFEAAGDEEASAPLALRVLREIGSAAPLVESIELVRSAEAAPPGLPPPGAPPRHGRHPGPVVVEVRALLDDMRSSGRPLSAAEARQIREAAAAGADAGGLIAEGRALAELGAQIAAAHDGEERARLERRLSAAVRRTEDRQRRIEAAMETRARAAAERRAADPDGVERDDVPPAVPAGDLARGLELSVPAGESGRVLARLDKHEVIARVLAAIPSQEGEVPFAICSDGELFVADEADRERLAVLPLDEMAGEGGAGPVERVFEDWVVATSYDPDTGLTVGLARPIDQRLAEVRRAAVRNFALGLTLIGLAVVAVGPLSRRMTRQLDVVTRGAERIALGDLTTRLPIGSPGSEIGQLSAAFNRMATDLSAHQERLLGEERHRRERELSDRMLRAEYERKSGELEDARTFQLSLLPKTLPRDPAFDLAVFVRTAAEVGGDFYDFHLASDGTLVAAVGDATGHGARAGTMVAVTKSLFSTLRGDTPPATFLGDAGSAVRRMDLGRMAMALVVARLSPDGAFSIASAGMPPALLLRAAGGDVEEISLPAMPLGGLDSEYPQADLRLDPGDTLLLATDGFAELVDPAGDPYGYDAVRRRFAEAAAGETAEAVVARLAAVVAERTGDRPPNDDVTFVVLRRS